MTRAPKTKLVIAWVDLDGFELTGGYRDKLMQHPAIRTIPQAKAARWGDPTPALKARLLAHIEQEKADHAWMGWFELPEAAGIMDKARALALDAYKKASTISAGTTAR